MRPVEQHLVFSGENRFRSPTPARRGFGLAFRSLVLVWALGFAPLSWAGSATPYAVEVRWLEGAETRPLLSLSAEAWIELQRSARLELTEASPWTEPTSAVRARWTGVSLNKILERALAPLRPEERARIDLVRVEDAAGHRASVPRALFQKVPVLLALGGPQASPAAPLLVLPWTSKADRMVLDVLPMSHFFVKGVVRIDVTSYRDRLPSLVFQKRRTDPLTLRGEKRFIQTCLACHDQPGGRPDVAAVEKLWSAILGQPSILDSHPARPGVPRLTGWDRVGIENYVRVIQLERNPRL